MKRNVKKIVMFSLLMSLLLVGCSTAKSTTVPTQDMSNKNQSVDAEAKSKAASNIEEINKADVANLSYFDAETANLRIWYNGEKITYPFALSVFENDGWVLDETTDTEAKYINEKYNSISIYVNSYDETLGFTSNTDIMSKNGIYDFHLVRESDNVESYPDIKLNGVELLGNDIYQVSRSVYKTGYSDSSVKTIVEPNEVQTFNYYFGGMAMDISFTYNYESGDVFDFNMDTYTVTNDVSENK